MGGEFSLYQYDVAALEPCQDLVAGDYYVSIHNENITPEGCAFGWMNTLNGDGTFVTIDGLGNIGDAADNFGFCLTVVPPAEGEGEVLPEGEGEVLPEGGKSYRGEGEVLPRRSETTRWRRRVLPGRRRNEWFCVGHCLSLILLGRSPGSTVLLRAACVEFGDCCSDAVIAFRNSEGEGVVVEGEGGSRRRR